MGETQRSSLSIPLIKRIHGRNTKVIALHPSTKENYGRNIEVIALHPSTKENYGRNTKVITSLYQTESPEALPPSTKEKRWEKHKGHHSPSLNQRKSK
jgi:hypothetical protein